MVPVRYRGAEEEGRRHAHANVILSGELEGFLLSLDAEREEVERGDCVGSSSMLTHVCTCSFLRVQEKG